MSNQQQPESSANQPKKMFPKTAKINVEAKLSEEKTTDRVHENKQSQTLKMKVAPAELHINIKENRPEMLNGKEQYTS